MVRSNERALFPPLGKKSELPHVEVGITTDSRSGRENTTTNVETRRVPVLQDMRRQAGHNPHTDSSYSDAQLDTLDTQSDD
jgi:hypothetical protein